MWSCAIGELRCGCTRVAGCGYTVAMPTPLRIVFCGTPHFAVESLRALAADARFDVRLVVSQPDRPVGRSREPVATPVKAAALALGIPVFQPERLNKAWHDAPLLAPGSFDILAVVAYGQLLSDEVLSLPAIAPVNVHASVLPRWRGAAPIQHAILAGDTESGVTVQRMVRELDAGPILGLRTLAIGPRETAPQLHDRLSALGATLLCETLAQPLTEREQDPSGVTLCGKLTRDDGNVDPAQQTAIAIDRRVRAFTPWPGVRCTIDGGELKLLETSLVPSADTYSLPCADGTTLHLVSVQPPSGKKMTGGSWARGRHR